MNTSILVNILRDNGLDRDTKIMLVDLFSHKHNKDVQKMIEEVLVEWKAADEAINDVMIAQFAKLEEKYNEVESDIHGNLKKVVSDSVEDVVRKGKIEKIISDIDSL